MRCLGLYYLLRRRSAKKVYFYRAHISRHNVRISLNDVFFCKKIVHLAYC